ncbi:transcription elongation factor TFIIS/CRSP70, partial [Tanacetum coccineum]
MEELQLKSVMDEWGKYSNVDIFDVIEKVIQVAATDHPEEFLRKREEIAHCLYWCEFSEEEKRRVGEVLRIKTSLEKNADCKSESVIYESLKKLHKMGLSFKVVDAADIGNTVSRLQHHASKQVKQIAEVIIGSWMRRAMFDRWVDSDQKMPDLHQEDEQGGVLKKNGGNLSAGNQESFPNGRDEQRVRLINSKGTMKEKLEAARRKLQ